MKKPDFQSSLLGFQDTEKRLLLSQTSDSFLLALQVAGRSQRTVKLYRNCMRELIAFLSDRPISEVSPGELRAFLAHLGGRVTAVTVGIRWRSLRSFFNWLYREGLLKESPVKRIKASRTPKQFPHILTDAQAQALIQFLKSKTNTWHGYRNYAIVLTFLDTGVRMGELRQITVNDLDLVHNSFRVKGKGDRERHVYFGRRLARVLREWLIRRTLSIPGDFLFCSRKGYELRGDEISHIVNQLGKEASITGVRCSPHTLRHTFATQFIRNGGDPFSLQRLLGHSDISTTMIYVHMAGHRTPRSPRQGEPGGSVAGELAIGRQNTHNIYSAGFHLITILHNTLVALLTMKLQKRIEML